MSSISYARPGVLSVQPEGRLVFYTGKTAHASAKASRTNIAEDSTSVDTVATSTVQVGSVLVRDPQGWDKGIGVDFTRPATALLHEQKVVVLALGNREYPDSISTDGPGRWVYVTDLTGECNVLIQDASVTTPTTGLNGSILGVVNGSFALADLDFPAAGGAGFTDNTTGTAGATLAAGVGIFVMPIHITLAQIAGAGDVLTNFTPGFRGKILSVAAAVDKVVTTGGKAATLNLEIDTTNVTGGAVALTSANCTPLGALVAGTAITAANTFTAAQTISIEAASVTAFSEGEVILLVTLQNLDTADAVASLAAASAQLKKVLLTGVGIPLDPALSATNLSGTAAAVKRCRVGIFGTSKTMP